MGQNGPQIPDWEAVWPPFQPAGRDAVHLSSPGKFHESEQAAGICPHAGQDNAYEVHAMQANDLILDAGQGSMQ